MRSLLDVLYNFHWIVPGEAARSAQPYLGRVEPFLLRHDIKAVINLRGRHQSWGWWLHEERICRRNAIAHFDPALNSRRLPTRRMLAALLDAFDASPRPLLVKCSGGQDRTSYAAALYVVHSRGWSALEEAGRQFAGFPYLHFPRRQQHWLRRFLEFAREDAGSLPLYRWARERYDPSSLATWLVDRGEGDSFKAVFGQG
ncbi:MAG: hypothetical protein KGJ78_02750 [Alphaproteobacteria bacterium]|nr:hypothetical protein [Alphaproteobacteria bacterium]